ncbi:MAG: ABC transporter ATP-binding protein [Planctomycetota bacterium]
MNAVRSVEGIGVRSLTRDFGALRAVDDVSFDVEPGSVVGLLGPNGSGKSTLLRMLLGLVSPTEGSASIGGRTLAGDGVDVRRRATFMPGEVALYGELTGRVHLAWLVRGRDREARARAVALADEFELPLRRRVRTYSHGMKRQLLFAAALAPDVPVRILDEPTEGLDPTKRAAVLEHVRADAARGRAVLFSSHHLGEVERACDDVLFLRAGRLLSRTEAARITARAKRTARVVWDERPRTLEAALAKARVEEFTFEDGRLHAVLDEADPRASLERLIALLPVPRSLRYGDFSLSELYRAFYGEEGV